MTVLIRGAGIIGLSIGWRLAREGFSVSLYDKGKAGKGASWAAAGMLGPYAESRFIEKIGLFQESLALYPQFLKELSEDAGIPLEFETQGTLMAGIDRDDRAFLEHLFRDHEERGFPVKKLSSEESREIEPLLSPRVTGALWFPTEWQIDNRRLIAALIRAFQKNGGLLHEDTPSPATVHIDAAGAWASDPRIRPNKGQIATLLAPKTLRLSCVVRSPRIYLVPKKDGILRVGATDEEAGFTPGVFAGPIRDLLNSAAEIVPAIDEMELLETIAAFRPLTEMKRPLIEEKDGTWLAAGHGRAGIVLAPYTAHRITNLFVRKHGHLFERKKTSVRS